MAFGKDINATALVGCGLATLVLTVSLVRLTGAGTLIAALIASAMACLGWWVFDYALAPLRAGSRSAGTARSAPARVFADTEATWWSP